MVDQDIAAMYDQVITYISGKVAYLDDSGAAGKEFNDFISEFDLTEVVYNIQRQVGARPTISESNIIKAYRDIRSSQAEYDIRLMKRSDYFADAAVEELDNQNKWAYNKGVINLHINGKDVGA